MSISEKFAEFVQDLEQWKLKLFASQDQVKKVAQLKCLLGVMIKLLMDLIECQVDHQTQFIHFLLSDGNSEYYMRLIGCTNNGWAPIVDYQSRMIIKAIEENIISHLKTKTKQYFTTENYKNFYDETTEIVKRHKRFLEKFRFKTEYASNIGIDPYNLRSSEFCSFLFTNQMNQMNQKPYDHFALDWNKDTQPHSYENLCHFVYQTGCSTREGKLRRRKEIYENLNQMFRNFKDISGDFVLSFDVIVQQKTLKHIVDEEKNELERKLQVELGNAGEDSTVLRDFYGKLKEFADDCNTSFHCASLEKLKMNLYTSLQMFSSIDVSHQSSVSLKEFIADLKNFFSSFDTLLGAYLNLTKGKAKS